MTDSNKVCLARIKAKIQPDLPLVEQAINLCCGMLVWGWMISRWFTMSNEYYSTLKPHLTRSRINLWIPGYEAIRLRYKDPTVKFWDRSEGYFMVSIPWFILHHVLNRLSRQYCPQYLPHLHIMVTCFQVASFVKPFNVTMAAMLAVLLLVPPILCYLISKHLLPARMAVYPAWVSGVITLTMDFWGWWIYEAIMDNAGEEAFELYFSLRSWGAMRLISICTAMESESTRDRITLAKCLGFFCYLPPSFLGPLTMFETYLDGLERPHSPSPSLNTYTNSLSTIFRMSFYLLLHHLLIHKVYVGIISFAPNVVSSLGLFSAIAVGGFRIMTFSAKYQCVYRITQTMQALDGFEPRPYPTCLAHVYHYTECWRLFDVGFHDYMKRFIYQPVMSKLLSLTSPLVARFIGMSSVYAFVWAYHGGSGAVFRWTVLNCIQVLIESKLRNNDSNSAIAITRLVQSLCDNAMKRRIHALLAVPSWFIGGVTLQYFFSRSNEVGDIFMHKVFVSSSWFDVFFIWLCGYFMVQIAIEVNNVIARRNIDKLMEIKKVEDTKGGELEKKSS